MINMRDIFENPDLSSSALRNLLETPKGRSDLTEALVPVLRRRMWVRIEETSSNITQKLGLKYGVWTAMVLADAAKRADAGVIAPMVV